VTHPIDSSAARSDAIGLDCHTLTPSDDVLSAHLDGEAVLLDMESKRYYRLNETASLVWRALEQGHDRAQIKAMLHETFAIDDARLDVSLTRLIETLSERGLVGARSTA
jgi:hypothetical protein